MKGRTSRLLMASALGGVVAMSGPTLASDVTTFSSPQGDAVVRRTGSSTIEPVLAGATLPDVTEVGLSGWLPVNPSTDPYTGAVLQARDAHLFRMQVRLAGLVNPPGTLGFSGQPFNPSQYGPSPLFGFFELDVDGDKDTGGELQPAANFRPLANASRFGARFRGSEGERQAIWGTDLDKQWYEDPQYVRSGADFTLTLCGCFPITVISKSNPGAATFGPSQTWVVQGRFFQRSGGYIPASAATGGSVPGAYDPPVRLQFAHDVQTNSTTVTLVYALDQTGAAQLAGHAAQPVNTSAADDTSIVEGLTDLIANAANPGNSGLTYELIRRWEGKKATDMLDPTRWDLRFIVGTTYAQSVDGLYVFTDVGPNCTRRDVDGDGAAGALDRGAIQQVISAGDGGASDSDGLVNGRITIPNVAINFSLYDLDGDGVIGPSDLALVGGCAGDFNGDGNRTVQDVFDFLTAFFGRAASADVNHTGSVTVQDVFDFLGAWFAGCP